MQLPQSIIDIVGNLYDEGMDDETILLFVLNAWELMKRECPSEALTAKSVCL